MKVIVKEPHTAPETREVEGICEINRIVGNVDDNGNGVYYAGSDYRMSIGKNIDMYVNTFQYLTLTWRKTYGIPAIPLYIAEMSCLPDLTGKNIIEMKNMVHVA